MKPVSAEIEAESIPLYGPGQAADSMVPFDEGDCGAAAGQQAASRETGEAGAQNRDVPDTEWQPGFPRSECPFGSHSVCRLL
ncbi:MAG: hypothetical protein ABFS30_17800 [Pseudomonadota bacterium]